MTNKASKAVLEKVGNVLPYGTKIRSRKSGVLGSIGSYNSYKNVYFVTHHNGNNEVLLSPEYLIENYTFLKDGDNKITCRDCQYGIDADQYGVVKLCDNPDLETYGKNVKHNQHFCCGYGKPCFKA